MGPEQSTQTETAQSGKVTTSDVYELTCTDCAFEAVVEGTALEALDVADDHQEKHGDAVETHFVNFERRSD